MPIWDYSVDKTVAYYSHGDQTANPFDAQREDMKRIVAYTRAYAPPVLRVA